MRVTLRGFSLVELMVSLAISMFLMLGITVFFQTSSMATINNMKTVRLNSVLRSAIDFMSREIMRSGHWSTATTYIGSTNALGVPDFSTIDPFKTLNFGAYDGTSNTVSACSHTIPNTSPASTSDCNCVVFAYDRPVDSSSSNSVAAIEFTGYRLNGLAIEFKKSGSAFSCTEGSWAIINPTQIAISNLKFDLVTTGDIVIPSTASTITNRAVTITLTGYFSTDTSFTNTLVDRVDIRNDVIN